MEVTTNGIQHPETGLPPPGQKPSKKQAKLLQQRLERLARVNIHLQGKTLTNPPTVGSLVAISLNSNSRNLICLRKYLLATIFYGETTGTNNTMHVK